MEIVFKQTKINQPITTNFVPEDMIRIKRVAKEQSTTLSEVVRALTLAALTEYEKEKKK